MHAADVDDAEAVVGADFVLHAVEVIFYGLFGEREVVGDFLVGEAAGDEWDELLFATGEAEPLVDGGGGQGIGFALEVAISRSTANWAVCKSGQIQMLRSIQFRTNIS